MEFIILFKVFYFYVLAFFLAILEIQIEGRHGWAEKLPAWRPKKDGSLDIFFRKISGQKELTGYHLALNIFILLFFHWPFIWNWHWDVWSELEILAFYILFTTVWDFLWFVLNPNYSLRSFNKNNVWWHKKWIGKIPTDYYFGIFGTIILFLPEMLWLDFMSAIYKIIILFAVNLVLIILTVIIYPRAY